MADPSRETNSPDWPPGVGMIYLGMSPWRSMWKNRHQLMSRFSQRMPVLYVEPPVYLRWLLRQGLWSGGFWRGLTLPTSRRETAGLTIMQNPYRLPVSGSGLVGRVTEARWIRAIRREARRAGIERPILWISLPGQMPAIRAMGEALSVYHVVDEYAGYTMDREEVRAALQRQEQEVLDAVDLVIVVSEELRSAKSGNGRSVHIVPNAVDLEGYRLARAKDRLPPELADIARPRLGYSGLVGKRLNLELLGSMARARPDWSVVLLGKVDPKECERELADLEGLPNVHFLGERPAAEVPDYVIGFDVGLLPYAINLETTHISPLKMYEYLGAGLPIVSTDIPAARRMGDVVSISEGVAEFSAACERALSENSDAARDIRLAEAARNTWEQRVDQIDGLIRRHLG